MGKVPTEARTESRRLCSPAELLPVMDDVFSTLLLAIHACCVSTITKQLQMRHHPFS